MRWRVLFFVSLGANLLLAIGWLVSLSRDARLQANSARLLGQPIRPTLKTNVVLRRQFFSWSEIESPDYPTFIANLRSIDCPEQTIRDIIIADVNALFSRRLATEVVTPVQQWWRSEPDPAVVQAANARMHAIDDERRTLLARLLGPDWEGGDLASLPRPSRPAVLLDGPVLGVLPAETKQAVEEASQRADDRLQAYLDAQKQLGKAPDPAELARLRQQAREDLTRLLTPPQLEEYLLRYSQDANSLRTELGQLRFFSTTPDEFRAMFRATDSIEQQLQLLGDPANDDPNRAAQRKALEEQRETALRNALGRDRYEEFVLLHDSNYQNAWQVAQTAGTPDAVDTLYEIALAAQQQQAEIRANTNLTAEQLAIELKRVELDQLKANAEATGQPVPPEPETPQPPQGPTTIGHVIQRGETIPIISQQFGVSVSAIRAANPNLDFNQVKTGDTIQIPQVPPSAPVLR
jgi:LysM repeat protein